MSAHPHNVNASQLGKKGPGREKSANPFWWRNNFLCIPNSDENGKRWLAKTKRLRPGGCQHQLIDEFVHRAFKDGIEAADDLGPWGLGWPADLAKAIGVSLRETIDCIEDLVDSGIAERRTIGDKTQYRIRPDRWSEVIPYSQRAAYQTPKQKKEEVDRSKLAALPAVEPDPEPEPDQPPSPPAAVKLDTVIVMPGRDAQTITVRQAISTVRLISNARGEFAINPTIEDRILTLRIEENCGTPHKPPTQVLSNQQTHFSNLRADIHLLAEKCVGIISPARVSRLIDRLQGAPFPVFKRAVAKKQWNPDKDKFGLLELIAKDTGEAWAARPPDPPQTARKPAESVSEEDLRRIEAELARPLPKATPEELRARFERRNK